MGNFYEITSYALNLARAEMMGHYRLPHCGTSDSLQEISQVSPGGNYLTAASTLHQFRDAYFVSRVFPNLGIEEWQARGQPTAVDLLRQRTRDLMDAAERPPDHAVLLAIGEEFINS
jgi:trimethylamine:corrinoid methyltransferase-like protein